MITTATHRIVLVFLVCVAAFPLRACASPWEQLGTHAAGDSPLASRAAAFLAAHRPPRDDAIDAELLIENLDLAIAARHEFEWAKAVPEELFLNDVLPYAVLDETRERWRPAMLKRCRSIVAGSASASEAAQALNRELFNLLDVHYNTGRKKPNQSPAESIAQGRATCTGLSILLVDACRSVGIPARIAGVARWHDKRGNHTWVEIWDNGWHFLGADEYDSRGLNRGWFTGDASKAVAGSEDHAVWASSFRPTGRHFPLVWNRSDQSVHAIDVTQRYTAEAASDDSDTDEALGTLFIRVFETRGGERIVAAVRRGSDLEADAVLSKAATADLNDMPQIAVPRGEPAKLSIAFEGQVRRHTVPASDEPARTIEIVWEELPLSREEAQAALARAFEAQRERIAMERAGEIEQSAFTIGDHTLRIQERTFGDLPDDGRSLWISLHGGGGAPTEVNDRQWDNQSRLYTPAEGIYVAPRAPTDTWNLWHQDHVDGLLDRLIESLIATKGVNPDRVFLLGYSAGGDGVFQLAPRMADRFAAAAMMAGHPNETSPLALRNLPFAVLMGAEDSAYGRAEKAREWKAALHDLRLADPEGYPHVVTIYEGRGHWMDGQDAEILPWMASHARDAWPRKIVWHQDDVTHARFYWLAIDPGTAQPRSTVTAEVREQTIHLTTDADMTSIRVRLHDRLLDLDQPVEIFVNGVMRFQGPVTRSHAAIRRSLEERNDPASAAFAELDLSWPPG